MTKAEIIEAIEATIRPNGEKAITAESLANLLIEMANATPEGGSGGSDVCVIQFGELEDGSDMTEEQLAYNVDAYNKLKEGFGEIPVFILGVPAIFRRKDDDGSCTYSFSIAYMSDPETYALLGYVAEFTLYPDGRVALMM